MKKTEWPVLWFSLSLGYFVCGMGSQYFMVLVYPLQDDCCLGKKLKFMLSFPSLLFLSTLPLLYFAFSRQPICYDPNTLVKKGR